MSKNIKVLANKYVVNLDNFLGKGGFASVYKGHMNGDENQLIAVKIIDKKKAKITHPGTDVLQYVKREKDNQLKLESPHIVKMIDAIEDEQNCIFILEYCEGGNLQQRLAKGRIPQEEALVIFKQILNGYKEIRDKNLIHKDLKPQNILFSKNIAKIGDFGFSKYLVDVDQIITQSSVGTPFYAAPEIKTKQFSSKADIWSLGLILYNMIYGTHPVEVINNPQLNVKQYKIGDIIYPTNKNVPEDILNLLKKMLIVNPENRISWDELFAQNLVQIIKPQHSEIMENQTISQSKINQIKEVLINEEKVEGICQYFNYTSDILSFFILLMKDIQNINSIVQFSQQQQLCFLVITTKYMLNELKFYQGILKGQNLFEVQILLGDFELFKKSDKYYQIFNTYKNNYESQCQFYTQIKAKFDKIVFSNVQNEDQKNWFNNIQQALDQDKNNQQFGQTFNLVYFQMIQHIQQNLTRKQFTNEQINSIFKALIRLLYCCQPLEMVHHKQDSLQIQENLQTTSNLMKDYQDLYEKMKYKFIVQNNINN